MTTVEHEVRFLRVAIQDAIDRLLTRGILHPLQAEVLARHAAATLDEADHAPDTPLGRRRARKALAEAWGDLRHIRSIPKTMEMIMGQPLSEPVWENAA